MTSAAVAELHALQELDLALEAARAALADVQSRLGESEEVAEAGRLVAGRKEQLRAAEHAFKERESDADELRRKIEPLEQKLYRGDVRNPKELEDLQRDVESLKRRRSELEDRALEAMEAVEQAQAALGEAQRQLAELDQQFGTEQAELRSRRDELEAEIAGLEQERTEQAPSVEQSLLLLYERLAPMRQGRAVAKVEGGACQGCRISLPMSILQRARSGNVLVQCPNCERILYVT